MYKTLVMLLQNGTFLLHAAKAPFLSALLNNSLPDEGVVGICKSHCVGCGKSPNQSIHLKNIPRPFHSAASLIHFVSFNFIPAILYLIPYVSTKGSKG